MKKILFLASVFGMAILGSLWLSFGISNSTEGAGTELEIAGNAWSSGIGWINFKSDSGVYGVTVNSDTGLLSGRAWSSNIGWITFNSSELANCPSGTCNAVYSNNAFSGWAKALSADGNGWDGWISLSGATYGLITSGTTITGSIWGGEVVGWIEPKEMSMPFCQAGLDDDNDGIFNEDDIDCGATPVECNDEADNDGDSSTDYPTDIGCDYPTDPTELNNIIPTTAPVVILKVGIGSPISKSLNIGKNGSDVKLGIDISNATTTTSCIKKTITYIPETPPQTETAPIVLIPESTTYTDTQNIPIVNKTKIEVSCTTDTETGSDSVDIIIKSENEF